MGAIGQKQPSDEGSFPPEAEYHYATPGGRRQHWKSLALHLYVSQGY